ncbi:6,7-dimethyl-8-ribityllumazine synthase [Candidatus Anaplasma sp. TIGMIC]|uniref:6,7-dimethyl-8-ribityllumazine synthase n=1 Tax=Candidatus Anaplasma sp. TIGMIC TaxID=3020713 RepID=UPI00232E0704|nr:6,7-dimethyl-8-ribityllumazine synthase [Candidatus Anaplasma sp. TIGMIC]MDB1135616.1 6,7-dimethyl-8-ribityllumazine synthase [Candidatus Anaplasma sp. TIGMIC]
MDNGLSALIVVGDFHAKVCEFLVDGAVSRLVSYCSDVKYEIVAVPGALEIPPALAFAIMSDRERYDGYIALGCILKGKTQHNDHVARSVYSSMGDIAVQHAVPLGTGVITAENIELALERADVNRLNVGGSAASAMLRMVELYRRFLGQ